MTAPTVFTQSSLGCYRACPRLYRFKYIDGLRPALTKEALRFGSLLHLGLEAWWGDDLGEPLASAFDALEGQTDSVIDEIRAQEILRGYDERWKDDDQYEVVWVEKEFSFPLVNPKTFRKSRTAVMRGKLDVLVHDNGEPVLIEHKSTASEIESDGDAYWQTLPLDRQLSNYTLGAESLGHEVREAIYDVIRKPQTRFKTATPEEKRKYTKAGTLYANQRESDESPDEYRLRLRAEIHENLNAYYRRRRVPRMGTEVLAFLADAWDTAEEIRLATRANRWPRNTDSCFRYGSPCPFITVCRDGVDPAESHDFVTVENVHSELKETQNGDSNAA